jgi:hypothetical protein
MLEFLAPDVSSVAERVVLSNMWLFSPLVKTMLDRGETASSIRTSTAVTRFNVQNKNTQHFTLRNVFKMVKKCLYIYMVCRRD